MAIQLCGRGLISGAIVLGLLLGAGDASAQEIKPYVMLLFDTSGSMHRVPCGNLGRWVNGDNSNECPDVDVSCTAASSCNFFGCGNGLADDTRIFKVKAGASSVVNAYGEVTFGVSRFRQTPAAFDCNHGGWTGGWCGAGTGEALGAGSNRADVLVAFGSNNQTDVLSWMNNCDDYPTAGACPLGVNPGAATPTTGCSLCTDCGTGCDKELRPHGATPIAGSLYTLRNSFFPGVITADTQAACRPYKVILLSDGGQSGACQGDPVAQAAALLAGTGLPNSKQVQVHVIGFGDATLKPALDGIAAAGGTGEAVIVDNEVSLALAMAAIISESILRESCNGADDDCDTLIDENWPELGSQCTAGLGICRRTGTYVCKADGTGTECSVTPGPPAPGGEICNNGLDDDCDGQVDEGCQPCVAQPEICDGKDNDCDGAIDEDYTSIACGSDIGECAKGTTACVNGSVVCNGSTPPTSELCNNKDDNCDTVVDAFNESCFASPTGTAYTSGCNTSSGVCVGACQLGLRLCTAGSWGACQGAIGPVSEICNGKDDDCDGQTDEGVQNTCTNYTTCATFQTCAACALTPTEVCNLKDDDCDGTVDNITGKPCGTDAGECKKGVTACDATGKEICSGGVGPTAETCNGKDDDCNGKIDDNATDPTLGQACGTNVGECQQGTFQCVAGQIKCVGGIGPQPEICDGKDNNCDGTADNGITATACGSDVGECKAGTTACVAGALVCQGAVGPSAELCDGLDNDCNGIKDDNPSDAGTACGSSDGTCVPGKNQCVNGSLVCVGATGPKTEVCDGLDNDCNGTVDDNILNAGAACGSDTGECQQGTMACQNTPSGWGLVCTGSVGPKPEICDGKDNDCDGDTDEDFPEDGQICGTNAGECQAGTWQCKGGSLVCEGGTGPTPEQCDGKDNDCNGAIDDNVPGEGQPCGNAVGECQPGTTKCVGGKFICTGGTQPGTEICDGKDNDCDGTADNTAVCPGSSSCIEGQCVVPCGTGEFKCPGGTRCENGYCIPDACLGVNCKDTERCIDGKCVDRCAGVSCKQHQKCNPGSGQCVDDSCLTKGCPGTQVCIAYQCIENPCGDTACQDDQMCVDGKCVDTCVDKSCPGSQVCVQGQCKDDPCAKWPCPDNQACVLVDGKPQCQVDPCAVITCAPGQVCRDAKCQDDPCVTAKCPVYLQCEVTHDGLASCVPKPGAQLPKTTKMLAAGGGGFGCAVAPSGPDSGDGWPAPLALLGLALLALRRRRGSR
jgi:MYXO-CTERM domain-containing protein